MRDKIDFGKRKVGHLFMRQLIPNVLGMLATALFIITDGIFVGRGIGSDALAAVNIVAPVSLFLTGVGLMFGMGGAIVASIQLSRDKVRVANINATQAVVVSSLAMLLVSVGVFIFARQTALLLGSPMDILNDAVIYLRYYIVFAVFQSLLCTLPFFVRIVSPAFSMVCVITGTVINILLDYVFIFVTGWGLAGAAIATGIGEIAGVSMLLVYLMRYSPQVKLLRLKWSVKSVRLTLCNISYMIRLGCSAFFSELTIALMMIAGNFVFARHLGVSGVAAYSIICYLFPIIFMLFNATVQSAQPIISYNYGCGMYTRGRQAFHLALKVAAAAGAFFLLVSWMWKDTVISWFITDPTNPAWEIATYGLPLFALDFIFFGINIVVCGYYMCVENVRKAITFTLTRGMLPVICFFLLPLWWGERGIWLAVPVAEVLITVLIGITFLIEKYTWKNFSNEQITQRI
ncbi:MAG: MATE family efflux transporter [Bacteroides sp.]|nr:MATE family efflux transporter [Bacteroides sp.]